ncbi:lipopolysaccharide heptosyltransferase I [secondary endosymbiont of Heteropsylla cubana]|uniref:Lipopolysaccharide heptosyltransferase 1 n=1 Tax=secondary endosymbiont of Heteropsylla cubana TaxID=134287 RepID=J3TGA6_9ENTR|nr:lipopolysaccharide heptosyltransferase RfaC [secondary endosymbiont of Heteropsylla cubana]AFP85422.1 lipopolysaccharide heptosyltransferase I [secondary endosymbiont of Heteropsylla cubana]
MQVLIVKISSMGDILHTLPALTDASHVMPWASYDWVVEENFSEIPKWHPAVRRVISIANRRWRRSWFSKNTRQERYNFKNKIQSNHYDVIIDAQGLIKSAAFITHIAFGEKHGMDYKSAREGLASIFYHKRHSIKKQQHAIKRIRQLFSSSLNYPLPNTPIDYAISKQFTTKCDEKAYIIFLHSTTRFSKHWPEKNWRSLIKIISDAGYRIKLPWGTIHERFRAQRLIEGVISANVLPFLSLTELAAQLANAEAIVSVDTGLSHLAGALNCPNLTLYGPTDPRLIGSYGRYQKSLIAEDGNMRNLTVESVWKTLQLMLSKRIKNKYIVLSEPIL